MPQIATVGLVGEFWEDGAIDAPEEPAGFRRKIRFWRVLRQAGGTKTTDIRAQREVVWKTARSVRAKKGRENVIFLQEAVRLSERSMAANVNRICGNARLVAAVVQSLKSGSKVRKAEARTASEQSICNA